uniref:Ras-specific guanine nucleotide-releasing factor RalGPS1 n=2 Tax=Schistocephalus solidus TaxID=70667 RepID=A0A0X3Q4T4_SCHSO
MHSKIVMATSDLISNIAIADITKVQVDDFAKQITLIEMSYFSAIKRSEFLSLKWNGRDKNVYAPNIVASTRWFNQLNFWVQKEILKYPAVNKRTEVLSYFIKLAKRLVEMNNLYSAMSMVSALQVECIYRLRHTWAGLGHRERSAYRRLEELFGQQDNCRLLREHTAAMRLPGIPYLGLYLSDLAYTNVAHPRINGQPTTVWVTKLNAIVDAIAHFQQSRFPFQCDETIRAYLLAQRYIEELQKFLEDANLKASLRLEAAVHYSTSSITDSPATTPGSPIVEVFATAQKCDNRRVVSALPMSSSRVASLSPVVAQKLPSLQASSHDDVRSNGGGYSSDLEVRTLPHHQPPCSGILKPTKKNSLPCHYYHRQQRELSINQEADQTEATGQEVAGEQCICVKLQQPGEAVCCRFLAHTCLPPSPVLALTTETEDSGGHRCCCREGDTVANPSGAPLPKTAHFSTCSPASKTLCMKELSFTNAESGSGSAASLSSLPPPCPSPSGIVSVERRERAIQVPAGFDLSAAGTFTDCLLCGRSLADRGVSVAPVSSSATVKEPLTAKPTSLPSTPTLQRVRLRSVPDKDAYSAVLAAICRRVGQPTPAVSSAGFQPPYEEEGDVLGEATSTVSSPRRCNQPLLSLLSWNPLPQAFILCEGPLWRKTIGRLIPPGLLEGRQSQHDDGLNAVTERTEDATGRLDSGFFSTSSSASVSNRFGSSWKPFWTTLVTIVGWQSVFIIYFEATARNPARRQDFSDSICKVQPFSRNHQPSATPGPTSASDAGLPSVGLARHRNGSIDETSFLLAHPAVKKTYRLRPIFPKASSMSKQTAQKDIGRPATVAGKEVGSPCGTPGVVGSLTLTPKHRASGFFTLSRKSSSERCTAGAAAVAVRNFSSLDTSGPDREAEVMAAISTPTPGSPTSVLVSNRSTTFSSTCGSLDERSASLQSDFFPQTRDWLLAFQTTLDHLITNDTTVKTEQ